MEDDEFQLGSKNGSPSFIGMYMISLSLNIPKIFEANKEMDVNASRQCKGFPNSSVSTRFYGISKRYGLHKRFGPKINRV